MWLLVCSEYVYHTSVFRVDLMCLELAYRYVVATVLCGLAHRCVVANVFYHTAMRLLVSFEYLAHRRLQVCFSLLLGCSFVVQVKTKRATSNNFSQKTCSLHTLREQFTVALLTSVISENSPRTCLSRVSVTSTMCHCCEI